VALQAPRTASALRWAAHPAIESIAQTGELTMSQKPEPQATTLSLTPRAQPPESDQEAGGDPAGDGPRVSQQLRRAVADLALQTTREGVWLIDKHARTTFVNERIAHLLGYTVRELLVTPLVQLLHEEGQRALIVSGGHQELRARRKDGAPIWLLVNAAPVYDREGDHAGSLAIVSDLSEQKATQQALKATVADLERHLEEARNEVAAFAEAAGLRPLQVGGLRHARELEGFQLLVMALQANPAYPTFNWGTGLKIID